MTSGPALPNDEYVSPSSLPGAVIDEKYRVERVIGRGGVGLVVAATHLGIGQRVAIKMIRDDVPMQRELLDRFLREARAAAMIRSDHVARVLDVGRLPTGRPYIVMEFLEGEDLERVVSRGPLPPMLAVDLAIQACEALAEAHRAGIIHRDLKPANLFLTRRADGAPLVKVLDFGISKITPLTAARTGRGVETTSIMGSPGYMAPEQMKSTRDVDARADVWALGTVLYETLVGHPAFEGTTMLEILDAIAVCDPILPSVRLPHLPAALDVVLSRCLQREPEKRYAGIAELAMALRPFASPAGALLADQALRISQEPAPSLEEPQFVALMAEPKPSSLTVVTPGRRRAPRLAWWLGGGLGLVVAVVAVGVFALRSANGPSADSFGAAPPAASSLAATRGAAAPSSTVWAPALTAPPPSAWASLPGAASSAVVDPPPSVTPPASVASAATPPPAAANPVRRPVTHAAPVHAPSPGGSPFGDRK